MNTVVKYQYCFNNTKGSQNIFLNGRARSLFRCLLLLIFMNNTHLFGQEDAVVDPAPDQVEVIPVDENPPTQLPPSLPSSVSDKMNYQGQLVDEDGNPWEDGEYAMIFNIFDAAEGGDLVWGPFKLTGAQVGDSFQPFVTVVNGYFNVVLGPEDMPEPTEDPGEDESEPSEQEIQARRLVDAFNGSVRYLEITINGDVLGPRQQILSTPFTMNAQKLGGKDLSTIKQETTPIGTVIDWWRPNDSFPVPKNFQIADGSVVNDPESPLNGETLPNLRNAFIRGAGSVDEIGLLGGQEAHEHNVDLPAHDHGVDLSHNHGRFEASTPGLNPNDRPHEHYGTHSHQWSSFSSNEIWTSGDGHQITHRKGVDADGNGPWTIYREDKQAADFHTNSVGHNHKVTVDPPNHSQSVTSSSHDFKPRPTDNISHLPPYVGLLKLVRIK